MKKLSIFLLALCLSLSAVAAFADDPPILPENPGVRAGGANGQSVKAPSSPGVNAPSATVTDRLQTLYLRIASRLRNYINISSIKATSATQIAMTRTARSRNNLGFELRS